MKSRMKKRIFVVASLLLIAAFLLSSTAGAAAQKLTIRVSYPKTMSVYAGKSTSLNLKLNPFVEGIKIKYTSRNNKIATVSTAGIVTGVRTGTTTITTTVGTKAFRTSVKVLKSKALPAASQPAQTLAPLASAVPQEPTTLNVPGSFVSVGSELDILNKCRASAGLPPLTLNQDVMVSAQIRAYEASLSFSHTRPDGGSAVEMIKKAAPSCGAAGENLAMSKGAGSTDPQYIVNLWMNSSGHRANILRASFTQVAIAAYQAPDGSVYWTQLFTGN